MRKKETKYMLLHGSTLKEGLGRESFLFTETELKRAATRWRKMNKRAEEKVKPFMVGQHLVLGRRKR